MAMKMSDELFEKGKNSKGVFTPINDDYGLVCKSMPVSDEELTKYVSAITKAKAGGINIAGVVDYRMIPGTTSTYNTNHGVVTYTKGVFLEDRAKGNSFENKNMYISVHAEYDYSKLVLDYLKAFLKYIEECERRAAAPQEMFDKIVKDCIDLQRYGLTIDPKPLNFFFHPTHGFTIIDVVSANNDMKPIEGHEYFPTYIYSIVLGYGEPTLYVGKTRYNGLPKTYQERLYNALGILEDKIVLALRNNGIREQLINSNVDRNGYRFVNGYTDVEFEDIETEVYGMIEEQRVKSDLKETVDINKFVITS